MLSGSKVGLDLNLDFTKMLTKISGNGGIWFSYDRALQQLWKLLSLAQEYHSGEA